MPLKNVRYRVVTINGKKVRLAFNVNTNTVVEAKNLKSGATHTEAEFKADRKKKKKKSK